MTSSVWGFTIGREALQGTTQPDVRPSNNAGSGKPGTTASKDQVSILKEKDILTTVKARVEGRDPEKTTAQANTKTEKASSKPARPKNRWTKCQRQVSPEQSRRGNNPGSERGQSAQQFHAARREHEK